MFEGLKKKFSSFIDSITKKEEQEVRQEERAEAKEEIREEVTAQPPVKVEKVEEKREEQAPRVEAKPVVAIHQEPKKPIERGEIPKRVEEPARRKEEPVAHDRPAAVERREPERAKPIERHVEEKQRAPEQKVSLGTRLKGIVFREVKVSEKDIDPFLEQLQMAMLQSDVNYDVADKILHTLRQDLTSRPIDAKGLSQNITQIIRDSILKVLNTGSGIDMVAEAKQRKGTTGEPFKILFLGPNGAGKTTTMAKVASMMMAGGLTCVLSASDTFRAAAIEQTAHHAGKLGIHVIKGNYGADPASVAFDAIAYAKAHSVDVVLIDSAGRQETNKSLMEEIKKMVRVARPDMKIFVGESIVGNALLGQVSEFNNAINLDGIILTKLDADAKGGNTLSILSETEVPILFFGTGEGYGDLMKYDPLYILDNLVPNN